MLMSATSTASYIPRIDSPDGSDCCGVTLKGWPRSSENRACFSSHSVNTGLPIQTRLSRRSMIGPMTSIPIHRVNQLTLKICPLSWSEHVNTRYTTTLESANIYLKPLSEACIGMHWNHSGAPSKSRRTDATCLSSLEHLIRCYFSGDGLESVIKTDTSAVWPRV